MPISLTGSLVGQPSFSINKNEAVLASGVKLQVSPLILFAILDHHMRRNEGQERVIGTLLGIRSGTNNEIVEVRNAFPVPHMEGKMPVELDTAFHENMYALHRRVNAREVVVGWYSTTNKEGKDGSSDAVSNNHQFYQSVVQRQQSTTATLGSSASAAGIVSTERQPLPAVHLVLDTSLSGPDIGLSAFTSSPLGIRSKRNVFNPVPCKIVYHDTERSGLAAIAEAAKNQKSLSDLNVDPAEPLASLQLNTARLPQDPEHLRTTVEDLCKVIGDVQNLVNVIAKKPKRTAAEERIGRFLLDTMAAVPEAANVDDLMQNHLQLLLMIMYLADLTKFQMNVSDNVQLAG